MRALFSTDWHIKLGQKHVPALWQINRFHMLVDKLNRAFQENDCDLHIIGGDILDKFDPSPEEIELYFDLVARLNHECIIYTGNHEMKTKTLSVLSNLAEETTRCNPRVRVVSSMRSDDFDIIDYTELHKKKWKPQQSRLCFTHVRGAIPPHVTPEIDLSQFDCYDMVMAGDLHSYQNTQATTRGTAIIYPGSPLTTTFHRERTRKANGYIILNTETFNYSWHELGDLPQLIRKTVTKPEDMIPDKYDRVIYELEGDIESISKVKNSDLLDKKINTNVGKAATLDIPRDAGLTEEMRLYFKLVKQHKPTLITRLLSRMKKVLPNAD